MIHDFAFEIVMLSNIAAPTCEIVRESQTPALCEPGLLVWTEDIIVALLAINMPSILRE